MGAFTGEDDASVVSVSDRSLTSLSSLPSDAADDMLSEIQQLRLLYERHKESQRPDSLPSNIQGNASIGSSITPFSAEAENDVRSVQSNGMPLVPVLEQEAPSTSANGSRAPPPGGGRSTTPAAAPNLILPRRISPITAATTSGCPTGVRKPRRR